MNWEDKLLGREDRYSPDELERYRNQPNDRACTDIEWAEALDVMTEEDREIGRKLAQVVINALLGLVNEVPAPSADEQGMTSKGEGNDVLPQGWDRVN